MTPTPPALLLDTCSIINMSYCSPVATLFKTRFAERAGWTRAVREELTRQRSRKPETTDLYLDTLRTHKRMRAVLTSRDLLSRNLGPWE